MARNRSREPVEAAQSSVMYDRILAQLKPDREITAGEFLKRAFTFPQIERIKIQKFAGGTWNFAEDVDNVGPAFDPNQIEAYLREKYGPWRFRFVVVANGEIITQHLVNLDGWQENEARSVASLPSRPVLSPSSKPVGPGATSELLGMAKERLEIENTTRLLAGLEGEKRERDVSTDLTPVKMMTEMMTGMMTMMKEFMTIQRGGMPKAEEDRFVQYLMDDIRFLREQALKPQAERNPDALLRTMDAVDGFLKRALDTSLAELATGAPKTEATGWAATIQGIIEGVKPYLPELFSAIKMAGASGPARPPGRVIPLPVRSVEWAPTPSPNPPPTEDEMAKLDPDMVEIINMLIDALKSKNHKTVDALLMNPPLQGRVVIDPDVAAAVYVAMFKKVDPRFAEMQSEIAAYQSYIHTAQIEQEKE